MLPNRVSFKDFEIEDPSLYLDRVPANVPCFWPMDWTLVFEESEGAFSVKMFSWVKNNCVHRWDVAHDDINRRIFAFESDEEATLFLMTF